ncbi:hypothetical protein [Streptomyces sp. NPDC007205]|uniref:hypothetical protein n=1 Tax=Streptomyces sp. NPDC007205 TaxID=3154316 RepID=UPI003402C0A1
MGDIAGDDLAAGAEAGALPDLGRQRWGRVLASRPSTVVAPIDDLAFTGIGRTAQVTGIETDELAAGGVTPRTAPAA